MIFKLVSVRKVWLFWIRGSIVCWGRLWLVVLLLWQAVACCFIVVAGCGLLFYCWDRLWLVVLFLGQAVTCCFIVGAGCGLLFYCWGRLWLVVLWLVLVVLMFLFNLSDASSRNKFLVKSTVCIIYMIH